MRTPHAGYATRRDLTKLARSSFVPLVALIAFGIVLVFIDIPDGSLIYAVAGLVIFAGLILFDFQRLRQAKDIRTAPLLAASIFLDVLNVFVLFLSIFSGSSEESVVSEGGLKPKVSLEELTPAVVSKHQGGEITNDPRSAAVIFLTTEHRGAPAPRPRAG